MAERIEGNLWRLDVPMPDSPLKNLNAYLILGDREGRDLLIDTGFRQEVCRTALFAELAQAGARLERLDVFLTHLHSDHSGLAPEVTAAGGQIFVSALDLWRLKQLNDAATWDESDRDYLAEGFPWDLLKLLPPLNPASSRVAVPCDRYVQVADGQVLEYGGRRLQCVSTPGHTPGHLCLWDAENRILFLGDHVLFKITPNICRWSYSPNALKQYLHSLEKLRNYDVRLPLPAHRQVLDSLSERIEQLLSHHAHRLDEVTAAVKAHPGSSAYDTASRMQWSIRCNNWDDFPVAQKWFAVGEAMSHLDYLVAQGTLERYADADGYFYRPAASQ